MAISFDELDTQMRVAAFEHVRRLNEVHDHLTANELKPGFVFNGDRIPLINPQRGIFKPQQMRFLLSIKTVQQPNGDVLIYTSSGTQLPTHSLTAPFSIATGSVQPASYYPGGGLPGIMLDGVDVTSGMVGGSIGALYPALRAARQDAVEALSYE